MKINILKAFNDSYRQSMAIYADCLRENLSDLLHSDEKGELYFPRRVFLSPPPLRWWSQYVDYPLQCRCLAGDVFHITDHVYSHLVHHLDSRKTVVTFHDAVRFSSLSPDFFRNSLRQLNLSGLEKAGGIICVSAMSKRRLLELINYPEEKIRVIHQGVEDIYFQKLVKEQCLSKLGIPQGTFYILHPGHTKEHKNIPALFHTLSILKKRMRQPVKILKAGTAFSSQQLTLAGEFGVGGDILHLGLVNKNDMPAVYGAADILMLPSFEEGFGFPLLEAMASGLPVTASNRGSIPEIAGDAALTADPENYEALAENILLLAQNPKLKTEFIQKGFERAGHFRWEETARKTLEVYREIYRETKAAS